MIFSRLLVAALGFSVVGVAWTFGAALEWEQGPGHRRAELSLASEGQTGFTLVSAFQTGVSFSNRLSVRQVAENRIYESGSGVALGDVNGDGWCDLYFCRLDGPNILYRNLGGWTFEDATEAAGVACAGQFSTGAVLADIDGDNDLDLLVNAIGGGTRSFHNDGTGRFTEDKQSRFAKQFGATSMALADIEGDGDLDLYVTNYRTDTMRDAPEGVEAEIVRVKGKIVARPQDRFEALMVPGVGGVMIFERGELDLVYLNRGSGIFGPLSWVGGAFADERGNPLKAPPRNWGLSVIMRDLNGDRHPDIYVCNDFVYSYDQTFLSERGRRYRAQSPFAMRNMSLASMAVDVADINRDGYDDVFVVDMLSRDHSFRQRQRANVKRLKDLNPPISDPAFRPEVMRNTLFLNRGDGTYAEIAQLSGVDASDWSWGAIFLDIDLDGFEDILVATGNFHDVLDADALAETRMSPEGGSVEAGLESLKRFPRLETRNLIFRNLGDLTFEEVGERWGFREPLVSHGMALGDLDNDGDLDVVVNNLNAVAGLYRNDSIAPRIAVRLKGVPPNTMGVGAKIEVIGGTVPQSQSIMSGGRYVSNDDSIRTFAAAGDGAFSVRVTWRDGRESRIDGVQPNVLYEVDQQGSEALVASDSAADEETFFEDVSVRVGHRHRDSAFVDFARQPLLTHKMSQLGPGVAWFDVDEDGRDDLLVGAGRGDRLRLFRNDGEGGFKEYNERPIAQSISRDLTSIIGWRAAEGKTVVLAGSTHYEDGVAIGPAVLGYGLGERLVEDSVPTRDSSVGPMALADIDADGDLDLFVGGRVIPGRYPEPASSRLFRQEQGKWNLDQANQAIFDRVGLVSGMVFTDFDNDGDPDLVLAREWASLGLFLNVDGTYHDVTSKLGMDRYSGLWNGVTAGDFDGDGRMDLIASNWGRNTKYQSRLGHPIEVYFGDVDGNGTVENVEAFYDAGRGQLMPWRDWDTLALALPGVKGRFGSYREFSEASIQEVLGEHYGRMKSHQVTTLDSMIFLNRGDRFEGIPLPREAQFAPTFGLAVTDFDGDGEEDVFLAQNFFAVEIETSRYDAGLGLLLTGRGDGRFEPMHHHRSGIEIFGEQRGAAVADYDADGRVDLAVGQNGGQTKVYRNRMGKPGLRVRLKGRAGNRFGVGAQVRVGVRGTLGPAREVHAGSGYLSQDSSTLVMGASEAASELWVRWPGGKVTSVELPDAAVAVEVDEESGIGRVTY